VIWTGDAAGNEAAEEILEMASRDMSTHRAAEAFCVVQPETAEEVAACVGLCASWTPPVVITPRGAGTGLEGGAIPYSGGIVMCTDKLKSVTVHPHDLLAVVGAGVRKNELNKKAAEHGLVFGPDPSSNPSIGGMASTGGSGMTTMKWGTSKENVLSLKVATPQGQLVTTRAPVRKSSTGYELTQVYCGSEGTLGIICELTVKLRRIQPVRCGALVRFPNTASAAAAVVDILKQDLVSLLKCEMLNSQGVSVTNKMFGTDLPSVPTLFWEFRADALPVVSRDYGTAKRIAVSHGAKEEEMQFADDGQVMDSLWEARRGCYLASLRYRKQVNEKVLITDVCVPLTKLTQCIESTESDFMDAGFPCIICAHIADGNFHALVPYQPHEEKSVRKLESQMIDRAIALGGTVSGEHGVGLGKRDKIVKEHGELHIDIQRRIKHALDPLNIMNPGKVLEWDANMTDGLRSKM